MKLNLVVILAFVIIASSVCYAQPSISRYYNVWQKDSIYYFVGEEAVLKFYSLEASGEFYLTNYFEKEPGNAILTITDEHLIMRRSDSLFIYSTSNAYELVFINLFIPGYTVYGVYGFGPYFVIRTGDAYHLYKLEDNFPVIVEDTLFTHPNQMLVFFYYPYVVRAGTVYKYVEAFDFYAIKAWGTSNVNTGLGENIVYSYFTWNEPNIPHYARSILHKFEILEPTFPYDSHNGWGLNIIPLFSHYGTGTLLASKNLFYFKWRKIITTHDQYKPYYIVPDSLKATITDYYTFLFDGSSIQFSKWNQSNIFYPFTWTDITSIEEEVNSPDDFHLSQNYPNPFNPVTKIKFTIPAVETRDRVSVQLKVYDVLGNEVATLVDEYKPAGRYEVEFSVATIQQIVLTSGVYFYQLKAGNYIETKKMILLK